mgnify:CR=1 FL=1
MREDVRGDRIGWVDERDATPPERILLGALEALRIAVNRELTLGLWRYEGHYALYPPGARYAPLAFETNCHTPDCAGKPGDPPNRFYTYGVVARLAMLAAAVEVEELVERASALEVRAANA